LPKQIHRSSISKWKREAPDKYYGYELNEDVGELYELMKKVSEDVTLQRQEKHSILLLKQQRLSLLGHLQFS